MSLNIKPFRIINDIELSTLLTRLSKNLTDWNAQYAQTRLTCELSAKPVTVAHQRFYLITNQAPIAFIDKKDLSIIQHCLLGEQATCFEVMAERFFITLLNTLFETEALQLSREMHSIDNEDWFYFGAPSLQLTLRGMSYTLQMHLHPKYVLGLLKQPLAAHNKLTSISEALNQEKIQLQVVLDTTALPLNDLMHLRVGDVIKTDHHIQIPLQLKHEELLLCDVDIGETQNNKTVQLTRRI